MADACILWKRLDVPGHESARLSLQGAIPRLAGTTVFAHEGGPCLLDYAITCDEAWRTLAGQVRGWVGETPVAISFARDRAGHWLLNDKECPEADGCIDIDLNFSPVTNLLPIRRLGLAVGQAAEVRAAWLRFPTFSLEPLPQIYRRLSETVYRYESAGGAFVADLTVDSAGFVTRYPNIWEVEAAST